MSGELGTHAVLNFPAEGSMAFSPGLLPEVKIIQQGKGKGRDGAGRPPDPEQMLGKSSGVLVGFELPARN